MESKQRIREHLSSILSSAQFAASERMQALLCYTVERSLEGNRDQLKESIIGIQVFGKEPGYDPRLDPVVRVMAGRLRNKLAQYYEANGHPDGLRIEYPKGSYVARFGPLQESEARAVEAPSIAVLPFASLSSNADDEFFSHGMTDAIIAQLAKLSGLRVISRTSVMQFKAAATSIPGIARTLQVNHILEGSVLRAGARVRIIAQLIAYPPERHLWAETYERDLSDVLSLQAEIAQRVAAEIRVRLSPQEVRSLAERSAVNAAAYVKYLEGKHALRRAGNAAEIQAGAAHLEEAVRLEPRFMLAQAALAECYGMLARYFFRPGMAEKARAAADLALSMDPESADARASLAQWYVDSFDWGPAMREVHRAIAANPNHVPSLILRGELLLRFGRVDEGIKALTHACRLDPLSGSVHDALALGLYRARRYDSALDQCRRALELDPRFSPALLHLAIIQAAQFAYGDALETLARLRQTPFASSEIDGISGLVHAMAGSRDEAFTCLARLRDSAAQDRPAAPHSFAHVYSALGDGDRALDFLEQAFARKSFLAGYLKVDPLWDRWRGHPRFERLVEALNLPG